MATLSRGADAIAGRATDEKRAADEVEAIACRATGARVLRNMVKIAEIDVGGERVRWCYLRIYILQESGAEIGKIRSPSPDFIERD